VETREASRPEYEVDVLSDVRIPVRDGLELSANLFLPRHTEAGRHWPAVLNMDPYRKDDWSAGWDLSFGSYLAQRGYAYCRLDVRGTGSSPGVAVDEYTAAETADGYDAVEWLAVQPWCDGAVGMWGLSYGGFTSLQVAALRPPHLRAIVPIQATDDRYTDDVHYVGGAMTVSELAQYAVSQVAMNALPPLPEAWGDDWRERWLKRLEATPVWLFEWARRQRDGVYWRGGSIAPAYERISAAILQLGGWMDEYVDAALRIQARCRSAPRRTIIGPWVHGLPDHANPGPNIDWRHELIRWFDHWLKGIDNGAASEPPLTWFQREFTPPERFPTRLNGSWRAVGSWPDVGAGRLVLALDEGTDVGRGRLASTATAVAGADRLDHRPTAGVRGGSLCWGAGHPPNGLAGDLRIEEPNGIVYTSDSLEVPVAILGAPVAVLHVAASEPVAHLVARLGDVAPNGAVEQVCEGLLNLTHRESHAEPSPLVPGRTYEVRLGLRAAGHRFGTGHRLRLSIATAHWPVVWPSPGAGTLTIRRGPGHPSRLELPVAPDDETAVAAPAFRAAAPAFASFGSDEPAPSTWEVVEDRLAETVTVRTYEASTSRLPDGRSTLFVSEALAMTASDRLPGTGRFENTCEYRLTRGGLDVFVVADGTTVAHSEAFDIAAGLRVEVDGEPVFGRRWEERIPRDLL
jgi:putative CocE/NonD family hydrolase